VKQRIEQLGGKVGKVEIGDEGLEAAVKRRSGLINGLQLPEWTDPSPREFEIKAKENGQGYREGKQPEMPDVDVRWTEIEEKEWDCAIKPEERWTVRQGTGADCSVAAGLGVCIAHNRLWDTKVSFSVMDAMDVRVQTDEAARLELYLSSRLSIREWKTRSQTLVERSMATGRYRCSSATIKNDQPATARHYHTSFSCILII
jgi:hypothetical protein